MKQIQFAVFMTYPAHIEVSDIAAVSHDFGRIVQDSRMVDGNENFQFPNTRDYEGKRVSGKVIRNLPSMLEDLIQRESLPIEIVGAQDFDYSKTITQDPEGGADIVTEVGECWRPMSRALWHNFMPDVASGDDLGNPVMSRPAIPDVGPEVVHGATPMMLVD